MNIAVVMPLFNGEPWIRQTLASVLAQSLPPREIIIVDDGSEDASVEIVRTFSEVALFRNPQKGTHSARQFGFEQTTSDYIAFLDQDDIWHPQHLEFLSTLLRDYPDTSAAFSRTLTFEADHELRFSRPSLKPELFDPWDTFPFHQIDTPSFVLIRRTALEAMGGWPTDNAWSSDVQAWFKLGAIAPMVKNASATAAYRVQHKAATSYQWRLEKAHEYFLNIQTTCEALICDRIKTHPTEADQRHHQSRLLQPMADLIKALETFDPALTQSALIQLESALSLWETSEGVTMSDLTIGTLLWYLRPTLETSDASHLRCLIKTLYKGQPPNIQCVGKLVPFHPTNEFSTSVLINYLLAEPWELRGWLSLVGYRGVATIAQRVKRLSRSLAG